MRPLYPLPFMQILTIFNPNNQITANTALPAEKAGHGQALKVSSAPVQTSTKQ